MKSHMSYDEQIGYVFSLVEAGRYEEAFSLAKDLVERNRLNLMANLLLAESCFGIGDYLTSYQYYHILFSLQHKYEEYLVEEEVLQQQMNLARENASMESVNLLPEERQRYLEQIEDVTALDKSLELNMFTYPFSMKEYFGPHRWEGKDFFLGRYDNWYCSYRMCDENQNGLSSKCEIFEIIKKGKHLDVTEGFPCLVPVTSSRINNPVEVAFSSKSGEFRYKEDAIRKTFMYYRLEEPTKITSSEDIYFGKPLILQHRSENKKLVLNIFLDSFNWYFIKKHSLEAYMPNTAAFFGRGMICNEFFSGSEFTYPSVATYWTGQRSTRHGLLNANVFFPLSSDFLLLPEIFREHGYLTGKIGGNYMVVPSLGYIRGVDRMLYEESEQNFHVQDVVNETLEHLRAFGEADNFMWIEIQDLHEVAGYWKMPVSVQARCGPHTNVIDNLGGSSLYQSHSDNREIVYGEQLRRIDFFLGSLYRYLDENYDQKEIVVTLFSDHGNGFNVEDGENFLSAQRMNVPLMVYGSGCESMVCGEWMETVDYPQILCHLAGIEDNRLGLGDGKLPRCFGGDGEKEYLFFQTLFPGRNYEASILARDYQFYFKSNHLVSNDCRIDFDGMYTLRDAEGQDIYDEALLEKCVGIVKKMLGDYLIEE